jgi:hypothetical protein
VDAVSRSLFPERAALSADSADVAVPAGIFAAWNARAAVVHRDALWALLLPLHADEGAADAWRSLWTQRLLWDTRQRLVFAPLRARVDRAEESAVAVGGDASARQALEAEREAREQGGRVARVLQGWSSSAESLSQRLVALFDTLKRAGLASAHDAALARAWTADLQRVGYRMPAIDDREAREAALRVCQGPVHALSSLAVPEELCSAMSSLSRPLLSIVTAGRNDDYAGMRRNRTQIFLDLVGEFARLGPDVQLELVVAEYNPPAETRSLAAEFRWPREPNLRVRIVTVPREVHAKLKARFGPDTPDLLEFIAKNAAIRAARGEFIVTTNMDDVFNPLVMELLRRRFFTRGVYYLADRKEARPERLYGLARSSYDEVYREHIFGGSFLIQPFFLATGSMWDAGARFGSSEQGPKQKGAGVSGAEAH